MVELEKCIIPTLSDHLKSWKRYVDDTLAFVKIGMHDYVLDRLNSFDEKIKFTYDTIVICLWIKAEIYKFKND